MSLEVHIENIHRKPERKLAAAREKEEYERTGKCPAPPTFAAQHCVQEGRVWVADEDIVGDGAAEYLRTHPDAEERGRLKDRAVKHVVYARDAYLLGFSDCLATFGDGDRFLIE